MTEFKLYNSVNKLPKNQWDGLTKHDLFLQTEYLEAFENACPNTICMYYVGVFKSDELVGVAVIQRVQLYLKDMFRNQGTSCFKEFAQNTLSKILKGNILVVGNLTHTGQHGIFFDQSEIKQSVFLDKIFDVITSYSIHYTKLYEILIQAIEASFQMLLKLLRVQM